MKSLHWPFSHADCSLKLPKSRRVLCTEAPSPEETLGEPSLFQTGDGNLEGYDRRYDSISGPMLIAMIGEPPTPCSRTPEAVIKLSYSTPYKVELVLT